MKSSRDTGLIFPTTLSTDEKRLKEAFEKLRIIRKAITATNKVNVSATVGDNLKTERKTTKKHIQKAEEATEEVKRKVLLGAVTFKKADEKKESFKRSSLVARRRDSEKTKSESELVGSDNKEALSPNNDDGFETYKPFSSNNADAKTKTLTDTSDIDDFETYKPGSERKQSSDGFETYKSTTLDETNKSDDGFDTYKPSVSTSEISDGFETYKPGAVGDNDDNFDTYNPSSSFNTFDKNNRSSPFGGSEQPKPCRGPCLYIRGYDLVSDSLRNVFSKYGSINRIFVEERQKSAFITYATTEEAENAMKQMDGNMVNGITLRVSFARRQNQGGGSDSGRFRGRSFDRNDGDGGGGNNGRFRGGRNDRSRGGERGRVRSGRRGRGRGRLSESADSFWQRSSFSENKDSCWPDTNEATNDGWPAAEESYGSKNDAWPTVKQSSETGAGSSGFPNVGDDDKDKDKEEDDFVTYKPGTTNENDDFVTWKASGTDVKSDDSSNNWNSDQTFQKNRSNSIKDRRFGDRRGGRRGGFAGDRGGRRPQRRGGGNCNDSQWQSRRRESERSGDDYWSTGDVGNKRKSSWPEEGSDENADNFWPSNENHSPNERNASVRGSDDIWPPKRSRQESSPRSKNDDNKDDFWSPAGSPSRDKEDNIRPSTSRTFRGGRRGGRRAGRRGGDQGRGGVLRWPHRDFDDKDAWSDERVDRNRSPEASNRSPTDAWPEPSDDIVPSSPPPPPPMSEVQVAWSEATRKTLKEREESGLALSASAMSGGGESSTTQRKPETRTQVTYDEDDPFA